jgi:hypothetical protein
MKRIWDSNANCLMAIDGEYEFELSSCYSFMKNWKTQYARKNSKKHMFIKLRCSFSAPDPIYWKYYIEVSVDGKIKEQNRICKEAYDYLKKENPSEEYGQVEFVTLFTFIPNNPLT